MRSSGETAKRERLKDKDNFNIILNYKIAFRIFTCIIALLFQKIDKVLLNEDHR